MSRQKQLLLCARETSSSESECGETDQQGPDLYMGCALSVDSCGDEPDPVPVRGSLRRERAKSRGNMRLTKVGTSRIHLQVKSSENMFTCVPQCRKIKTLLCGETHVRSLGQLEVTQVVVMSEVILL